MKKFISILMTVLLVSTSLTAALAVEAPDIGTNQLGDGATDFVGGVLGTIQFVAYAIAIGMLIYVGIKYVMASANEKADLKNAMIKYVIGAILIAGAATIAGWIFSIGDNATE